MKVHIFLGIVFFVVIQAYAEDLKNCRLYDKKLNIRLKESASHRPVGLNDNYPVKYEIDSSHNSFDISSDLSTSKLQFIGEESFSTQPWLDLEKMNKTIKSIQCAQKIILTQWDDKQKSYNRVIFDLIQAGPKLDYAPKKNKNVKKREIERVNHQCHYAAALDYTMFFHTPEFSQQKIECDAKLIAQ